MLVVTRFRSPADDFRDRLESALAVLAVRPGFLEGRLGRNVDEPELWTMVTVWQDVGSYRRALSAYEVKVAAVPLLGEAFDEPSAYELLDGDRGRELNRALPRDLG